MHDHSTAARKCKTRIVLGRTNAVTKLLRQSKDRFAAAVLFSRAQAPLLTVGFMDQQNGREE
jgi:hypothetical protein